MARTNTVIRRWIDVSNHGVMSPYHTFPHGVGTKRFDIILSWRGDGIGDSYAARRWAGPDGRGGVMSKLVRPAEELSRASEESVRDIFERAPIGIVQMDLQGHILAANSAVQEFLGYDEQEFRRLAFIDVAHPEGRAADWALFNEVLAGTRDAYTMEKRCIRKDGGIVWAHLAVSVARDSDGDPERIIGMLLDVTERRLAEERVRKSELRHRRIVEAIQEGIWELDAEGMTTFVNQAMVDLLGYSAEEMLGQPVWPFLDPAIREQTRAVIASQRAGTPFHIETCFRHRDNHPIWARVAGTPLFESDGSFAGVLGLVSDITARKEMEAALRASEDRYRQVERHAPIGLALQTPDGRYLRVNPALCALVGYSEAELLVRAFQDITHPDDVGFDLAQVRSMLAGETATFQAEKRYIRKDGTPVWVLLFVVLVRGENGQPAYFIAQTQDISARKAAEARLRDERDLLQTLMDAVPDAIYVEDLDLRFVRVNLAQARALGAATPEEVLGKTDFDYFPSELARQFGEQEHRLLASGEPRFNELEDHSSFSHGKHWILSSKVPIRQDGRIIGLVGISRDITALKQAQEERERFFTMSPDPLCVASLVGYFKDVNPAFAQALSFTAEELCAEPFMHFVHPEDWAASQVAVAELAVGVSVIGFEIRFRCKDGAYRWFMWTAIPVPEDGIFYAAGRDITERREMEQRLHQQIGRMSALHAIDTAIAASMDQRVMLGVVLEQVCAHLGVDAAQVLVFNKHLLTLEYAADRGFRKSNTPHRRLRLGQGYAGRAALERRLITAPDFARQDVVRTELITVEQFVSYAGAPLIAKGKVLGVLEVFHRAPLAQPPEWLDFLSTLAGQAAIAIDNATLFTELQQSNTELVLAYDTTIEGWSRALDLRDKETEGHSRRVTEMALRLAEAMGLSGADLVHVRRGALLHDIGKMGVPDGILLKPGPLTEEEWVIMRRHPTYAYDLLRPIRYLRPAVDIPYCHHEKWDGTGYPRGLRDTEIPLAARIFAVVDVWDALSSNRPYRDGWPEERVRAHIAAAAGTHFDPGVAATFLAMDWPTDAGHAVELPERPA